MCLCPRSRLGMYLTGFGRSAWVMQGPRAAGTCGCKALQDHWGSLQGLCLGPWHLADLHGVIGSSPLCRSDVSHRWLLMLWWSLLGTHSWSRPTHTRAGSKAYPPLSMIQLLCALGGRSSNGHCCICGTSIVERLSRRTLPWTSLPFPA